MSEQLELPNQYAEALDELSTWAQRHKARLIFQPGERPMLMIGDSLGECFAIFEVDPLKGIFGKYETSRWHSFKYGR